MSIFSETQQEKVNYSTFNLSHQRKFTFNAGYLTPSLMQETIPSDNWEISTNQLMRMMPMLAPVMHEVQLTNHVWFVPLRLLWNQSTFEKFMTGGDDGMAQIAFPTIKNVPANDLSPEGHARNKLADYLGLPAIQDDGGAIAYDEINPFPFLAYTMVYMEYYRDQNLEEYEPDDYDITKWTGYPLLDYNNLQPYQKEVFTKLRQRAWQHDYFTSALPFAQKGEPVRMPLGETAPIILKNKVPLPYSEVKDPLTGNPISGGLDNQGLGVGENGELQFATGVDRNVVLDNSQALLADLTQASSATIIEMRKAVVLQQWMERRARSGSRYIEYVKADFNVNSSDSRLQRPEFCGGATTPVLISETLQTSGTGDTGTPQGNMAGHGVSMGGDYITSKYCEEHGFIIMLTTVMPKTGYHQGMPKIWKKFDRFDYGTPMFQHIGEQEVTQGELFYQAQFQDDQKVFGYVPRYSEYKFINNSVHGYFKNSLDFWTWDRKFSTAPVLNKEFIACNPTRNIFAVEDDSEDTLLCQMFHTINVRRPFAYFSSPGLERL